MTKTQNNMNENKVLRAYAASLRERFGPGKRLLLVQAPQFLFETINPEVICGRGYYAYPPTGLQRLAESLSGRDIEVRILDLNLHVLQRIAEQGRFDPETWLDALGEQLDTFHPNMVGVTCLTVYTDLFATNHPLTSILRNLASRGEQMVIIGGPTATNEMDRYLQEGLCHFAVEGEGEDRLNYLLDVYDKRPDSSEPVSGVSFLSEGKVLRTTGRCASVELRGNLIGSYAAVDVEQYCRVGSLNPYSRMAGQDTVYGVFQLSRGCRGNCKFCGVRPFMGKGIRTHPVDELIAEIRYLVEQRSVRHFEVLDDDLLADRQAVTKLLRALGDLHREHGITWAANNGLMTHSITRELLDLMRDSGCLGFKIGVESGNAKMLRRIRKPGSLESFANVADMLQDYPELFVGGNYIIGLFGEETFAQMLDTFAFSVRLNLDWSSFTVFQFTSKPTAVAENLKTDGAGATDFIPGKDSPNREIQDDRSLPLGPDVFSISGDVIPSRALVKNVWLTFNLLGNYVGNKNLKPGGRPEKFVAWLDAVRVAYPKNPYMVLFAGLGRILIGVPACGRTLLEDARSIVDASENWQYRFSKFGLDDLLGRVPRDAREVHERLAAIQQACLPAMCVGV
ncbi:MAG TPA: radical SAM protein [Sedimentisphaerales bacterium]|nr:radical SAM protein [Sedimentisphaerales bacterium]